jgi:predicted Na+-dependent transporter
MQLMVCAILAKRYARQQEAAEARDTAAQAAE